jgi:hypothetical protein
MKSFNDTPMCDLVVQRRIPERTSSALVPTFGMRFLHSQLLTSDYKSPQLCQVTRVAHGMVYYRCVDEGVLRGHPELCSAENFRRYVKAVVS